jgi:DNA mismatch repair protein MutS2
LGVASFQPGDAVHVALFGKGIVREVRNSGRYLVEIKGRAMEVAASQLTPIDSKHTSRAKPATPPANPDDPETAPRKVVTLDLHGHTVEEALDALEKCLNDALLAGASEVQVIHGRSGGRVKAAVHRRLRKVPSVRAFRIDSENPGRTMVAM